MVSPRLMVATGEGPGARLGRRVWLVGLSVIATAVMTLGKETIKLPPEERYLSLVNRENLSAIELYRIGRWCFQVAEYLDPEAKRQFRQRGRDCTHRAESRAREAIVKIFFEAEAEIERAPTYEAAADIRDQAERKGRAYLNDLLEVFQAKSSVHPHELAYDQGLKELDKALGPIRRLNTFRKVEDGFLLLEKSWIPVDKEDAMHEYSGRQPLSRLAKTPEEFLDRLATTEFISGGRLFDLFGHLFLDGFDDRGDYLAPNFMTDRLAVALPPERAAWRDDIDTLRQRFTKEEKEPAFRFRVLVKTVRQELQYTSFYLAAVQQVAIFDEEGVLLEYLGPHLGD